MIVGKQILLVMRDFLIEKVLRTDNRTIDDDGFDGTSNELLSFFCCYRDIAIRCPDFRIRMRTFHEKATEGIAQCIFFSLTNRRFFQGDADEVGKTVLVHTNIVFTSNKHPSHWRSNFNEDDALLCALDRIFDDATVFNIKGESFRGKKLETVALQTSRVKAPDSSETPTL